jgi:hypothetical protein
MAASESPTDSKGERYSPKLFQPDEGAFDMRRFRATGTRGAFCGCPVVFLGIPPFGMSLPISRHASKDSAATIDRKIIIEFNVKYAAPDRKTAESVVDRIIAKPVV